MSREKIPTELLKGNMRMFVLGLLREGPTHGYAIVHEIELRTNKAIVFRHGTLYPLLHELEENGFIVGEWQTLGDERPKKVYSITDKGQQELELKLAAWKNFSLAVTQVISEATNEA